LNGKSELKRKEKPHTSLSRLLAVLAVGAAAAAAQAQVSLKTVVELAQSSSSSVKLAQTDVLKARGALQQVEDAYIPNLSIGSTVGYSYGFPTGQPSIANAQMQSLVLSFPQQQYMKSARAGLKAAELELKDAREQVALDASMDYVELDTMTTELDAARQQESFAGRAVEIEQQRTVAGVDAMSDLLQARLTAAQLKLKRLHLETRLATLAKHLASLTGLPAGSITPDHASIPEVPAVGADEIPRTSAGIESSDTLALSKQLQAKGDSLAGRRPLIGFGAIYNLDSDELNSYSTYYKNFTPNNVSFGLQIQIPFFDFALRAKARQSAAESLRATVEAEQARRQNDVQIVELTSSLRELDALAEVASLKQQIADEQLKAVLAQLELGNGAGNGPGAPAQLSPRAEQQARIDERQKYEDALDAALDLSKARLNLLRVLGHMQDWLDELRTR